MLILVFEVIVQPPKYIFEIAIFSRISSMCGLDISREFIGVKTCDPHHLISSVSFRKQFFTLFFLQTNVAKLFLFRKILYEKFETLGLTESRSLIPTSFATLWLRPAMFRVSFHTYMD